MVLRRVVILLVLSCAYAAEVHLATFRVLGADAPTPTASSRNARAAPASSTTARGPRAKVARARSTEQSTRRAPVGAAFSGTWRRRFATVIATAADASSRARSGPSAWKASSRTSAPGATYPSVGSFYKRVLFQSLFKTMK
eukprot:CAMPEP_0184090654 /NCGR_PEP_ID=MMETSP0974-20121125/7339_1 /TAXON_ID=483370 /ORGANISM="non described non described, Strain CCMP2097" /LENGTH=140 /DNA_ID=CAMNT_0026393379 /DNA_START=71 /DNA_END=491 /DNA_ORIENTATION=+